MEFSDSQFMTAEEKSRLARKYQAFVESSFKRQLFSKSLYQYLSVNFSFIAHYDIDGFYRARFADPIGRAKTFNQIMSASKWEFTAEPHRTGDLNKAVYLLTEANASIFFDSAKEDRIKELEEIVQAAEAELKSLRALTREHDVTGLPELGPGQKRLK
jgi:hypothetical protein